MATLTITPAGDSKTLTVTHDGDVKTLGVTQTVESKTLTITTGIGPTGADGIVGSDSWTSSLTAPVSPANKDKWFLTSTGQLFEYYEDVDTSQWVEITGSFLTDTRRSAYASKTATYAISSATDYAIEATSGSFTVTLPTAVSISGQEFIIKNSGAGVITIATTSSQTIDGATTANISTQYESLSVMSNGVNWVIT
jgi:hypothetical protein